MTFSYDRRAASVPSPLPRSPFGPRSGYELRVIGFLSDIWPFMSEDKLDSAARGVDTMKRKHPDLWKGMVEVNLAPKAVAEIIVRVALTETQTFKSPRTAAALKELQPAAKAMTRVMALAKEVQALTKVLEEEWPKLEALEKEGKLPPTGPYRTAPLVREVLQQVNKGHFQDARGRAEWLLKQWKP